MSASTCLHRPVVDQHSVGFTEGVHQRVNASKRKSRSGRSVVSNWKEIISGRGAAAQGGKKKAAKKRGGPQKSTRGGARGGRRAE